MKILLDDRLPQNLRQAFPEHKVVTLPQQGSANLSFAVLLELAGNRFDVFMTIAQEMPALDDFSNIQLAVIVLIIPGDRVDDLQPVITQVQAVLETIEPGELICLSA